MRTDQHAVRVLLCCCVACAAFGGPIAIADDRAPDDPYGPPDGPIFQQPQTPKLVTPKYVCSLEAVIGSHIMHRTCRSVDQVAAERAHAEQVANSLNRYQGRNYGTRSVDFRR